MQNQTITVPHGVKYLSELWNDFPSKSFINKQMTGAGATHLAITNDIDYIILVPTIDLLLNKCEQHDNLIPLYGKITNAQFTRDFIRKTTPVLRHGVKVNKTKKIIATYDALTRILNSELSNMIDPSKFKLLVDESHTIVINNYKNNVNAYVVNNYDKFYDYTFISATPNRSEFLPEKLKTIDVYNLEWTDKVTQQLNLVKMEQSPYIAVSNLCSKYIDNLIDGTAHIFYNCVKDILKIVSNLIDAYGEGIIDLIAINCSKSNPVHGKSLSAINHKLKVNASVKDVKLINFYTSTAFEGLDIYADKGRTYIVADAKRTSTMVEMECIIPQIIGRVRNSIYKYDAIDMLVSGTFKQLDMTYTEYYDYVNHEIECAEAMVVSYLDLKNRNVNNINKDIIESLIKTAKSDRRFIYDKTDNSIDTCPNYIGYMMMTFESLNQKYIMINRDEKIDNDRISNIEYVDLEDSVFNTTLTEKIKFDIKVNFKDLINQMHDDRINNNFKNESYFKRHAQKTYEMYIQVGYDRIKSLAFVQKRIENEINYINNQDNIYAVLNINVNDIMTRTEAKELLQIAFDKLNIDRVAKASTLDEYFVVKRTTVNNKTMIKIVSKLDN